ncbi:MAG TPA: hypothetical protein VGN64_00635 [Dyadobacter sp.]|jgi:hypothetical protein|nr:hypothetical protein [Dyadobacter sp.]
MANFREYITNLFRSSRSDEEHYYDDEPVANQEIIYPEPITQPQYVQQPAVASTSQEPELLPQVYNEVVIPYWLEDEDTLRDEGVLFGLSESDPTEKTDIIHKYFVHLAAGPLSDVEQHNERIQEFNLFIGQKTDRIEALKAKADIPPATAGAQEHHLPRTLIGLTLSAAMCIGNFFLIRESLRPAFAESSWIATGIFLAGMFSLFGRISIFHDKDSKVTWRSLLEEIGLPFAASLFVFAQVYQSQGWLQAIALFVFIFFLFLFAGKLFLSNITVLRSDFKAWQDPIRDKKQQEEESYKSESEIQALEEERDALRVKKWQAVRDLSTSETERDRIYARRDMLIKLFESEFFLARRMKGQLSGKQLNYIQKGDQ